MHKLIVHHYGLTENQTARFARSLSYNDVIRNFLRHRLVESEPKTRKLAGTEYFAIMTKYSHNGPLKKELSQQASWSGVVTLENEPKMPAAPSDEITQDSESPITSGRYRVTQIPIDRQAPEKNTAALTDAKVVRIAKQAATGQYIGYNKAGVVLGWLNYRDEKNRRVFFHTETNPIFRGKGVADHITKHAMDDAAQQNVMVEPSCWYAAEWVQRNPGYAKYIVNPAY